MNFMTARVVKADPDSIHLIFPIRAGAAICKFYVSSFQSHLRPDIFSCTKQLVLLLDIENGCVLPYYFNVLS